MPEWTTRLAQILGAAPQHLTADHLARSIAAGTREDSDLDFKETLYGNGDGEKREMAADIASLANDRGGILILGVKDDNGIAIGLPGVDISESEALRMKSVAASLIAPHVPFDVVPVGSEGTPGRGFLIVVVPPSPWRPHAVRKGIDLRYPRRDGPSKRWMTESEVADLYRDRFRQANVLIDRLGSVVDDGFNHVALEGRRPGHEKQAWLGVGLVPENAGTMRITLAAVREHGERLSRYVNSVPFTGVFGGSLYLGSGVKRLWATDQKEEDTLPTGRYAELHTDGSGCTVAPMWWPAQHAPDAPCVIDHDVVLRVAAALRMLADHAVHTTGAYGDALIQIDLFAREPTLLISGLALQQWGDLRGQDSNTTLAGHVASRHTLALSDLTGAEPDLLGATALVLTEIFQAFGTAEIRHLRPDGAIRIRHWSSSLQTLISEWAQSNGVSVTDETLPNI